MSKPVKALLRKNLAAKLDGVTSLAVVGFTGLDAIQTGVVRGELEAKDIRLTVVKNAIARQAFEDIGLPEAKDLLDGPCALAYGADSVVTVVRTILELAKEAEQLTVKSALLDGEIFGEDRVVELSKFPTRDEAIAKVVGMICAPGRNIAGCLMGPAGRIAGAVKTVGENAEGATDEAA